MSQFLKDLWWFLTHGQRNASDLRRLGYGIGFVQSQSIAWSVARPLDRLRIKPAAASRRVCSPAVLTLTPHALANAISSKSGRASSVSSI